MTYSEMDDDTLGRLAEELWEATGPSELFYSVRDELFLRHGWVRSDEIDGYVRVLQ